MYADFQIRIREEKEEENEYENIRMASEDREKLSTTKMSESTSVEWRRVSDRLKILLPVVLHQRATFLVTIFLQQIIRYA